MTATLDKKFDSVKVLYEMGSNPLLVNKEGINCIHIAAANNDVQVLNFLLKKTEQVKGVVNLKSNDGWTAAHLAAIQDCYDSLNLLIERGANLFERHNSQMTVFDEIVRSDNAELLEIVFPNYK